MTEEKSPHEGHPEHTPHTEHASHAEHAHQATHTHAPHESHATHTPHETGAAHKIIAEIPKVDLKGVTPDALKGGFTDVIEILKLNKTKIDAVAGRESEGITIALIYLAIGSVASMIGSAIFGYSLGRVVIRTPIVNALIGAVLAVVIAAVVYYITNLVAVNLFKGKGKFSGYFRVMGYASLLNVLGILTMVSILGSLAGIYVGLVINFIALKQVHKLDTTNAVLTIIVSAVASAVLVYLLALVGLSAMIGGGGMFGGMMGGIGGPGVTVTY